MREKNWVQVIGFIFAVTFYVGCSDYIGVVADVSVDGTLNDGSLMDGPRADLPFSSDGALADIPAIADGDVVADILKVPDSYLMPGCHPAVVASCADGYCKVPAGCFLMGSLPTETCRGAEETLHQVTFAHGFEMGQYETTQDEYFGLTGKNPSGFTTCGGNCPVEGVNWHEAAAYCNALSKAKGYGSCYECTPVGEDILCATAASYMGTGNTIYSCPGYRLPTEAEFEYARRAGVTYPFYNGPMIGDCAVDANADKISWYDGNAGGKTHPGGQKVPNGWGFYDLSGNVWEWQNDFYYGDLGADAVTDPVGPDSGTNKMLRGGCWDTDADHMRASYRRNLDPERRDLTFIGFRCVRSQ